MDIHKQFHVVANELIAEHGFSEYYREPFYVDVMDSLHQIIIMGIDDKEVLLLACSKYLHRGDVSFVSQELFNKIGKHWCIYNWGGKIRIIGRDKYGTEQDFPHNLKSLS